MRLILGICAFAASAAALIWAALRPAAPSPAPVRPPPEEGAPAAASAAAESAPKPAVPGRYPAYGWCGLAALALLEAALALRVPVVRTFFTAFIWTAFLPAVDAAVRRRRGTSLLSQPGRFAALCLLSVPIWLIFEAYNLRLKNWSYVGVPAHFGWFLLGGAWAFATILPGIYEVADLFLARGWESLRCRAFSFGPGARGALALLGLIFLLAPLAASRAVAPYLFGPVWVGFVLLLEPLNLRLGAPSLARDLELGAPGRLLALLASGAICGFCWEFWNYWAAARWEYIFPIGQSWKVFAMPLPGFLGFPPFALECFALTGFAAWLTLPGEMRPRLGAAPPPRAAATAPASAPVEAARAAPSRTRETPPRTRETQPVSSPRAR